MLFHFRRGRKELATIEQIGRDMFMVTKTTNGRVSQKEVDADDMIGIYHSLLDQGYTLVKKGE